MASAYFEVAFFTGMRSEELIALRWCDIDWNDQTIRVERARTAGELKPLKTYNARDIDLVSRALAALQTMKPWTMMRGMEAAIFQNVETNKPLYDERSQRDHFWTPTLRRLGIRHRRAYQTRHTYATNSHWQQGPIRPTLPARWGTRTPKCSLRCMPSGSTAPTEAGKRQRLKR